MPLATWKWMQLAGGFPATLVTNAPATVIDEKGTPDATGVSLTAEGYLTPATCPSGTTRIVATGTGSYTVYEWHYNRLWYLDATNKKVVYGAPEYRASLFSQGIGELDFRDDATGAGAANALVKMLPIGEQGMVFFKASGAYIVANANDQNGQFAYPDFVQEAGIAADTHAVELDGTVYYCANSSLYALNIQGQITEVGYPVRGQVTAAALKADYLNKLIVVGTAMAYDTVNKRWAKYSGSTFNFTSRALLSPDRAPLTVLSVGFEYELTGGVDDALLFNVRMDERDWSENITATLPYRRSTHNYFAMPVPSDTGLTFQMKITSMATTTKLRAIMVQVQGYTPESRRS